MAAPLHYHSVGKSHKKISFDDLKRSATLFLSSIFLKCNGARFFHSAHLIANLASLVKMRLFLVFFPTLCTTVFVIFVLVMLPAAVFCCVPSAPHEDIWPYFVRPYFIFCHQLTTTTAKKYGIPRKRDRIESIPLTHLSSSGSAAGRRRI